jgi:hypothetical protein
VEALFRSESRGSLNESLPPYLADSRTICRTLSRPPLCFASVQEEIEKMMLDWASILFVKAAPVPQTLLGDNAHQGRVLEVDDTPRTENLMKSIRKYGNRTRKGTSSTGDYNSNVVRAIEKYTATLDVRRPNQIKQGGGPDNPNAYPRRRRGTTLRRGRKTKFQL